MRQTRIAVVWIAVVAVSIMTASVAVAKPTIKELMGENFAGLQTILVSLINSNYAAVPAQADIIRDHATQLTEAVPASSQSDRDRFLGLALSLKTHAESLKEISEILTQHDREELAEVGDLGIDQLRESLAAHYGGMVVTCVACHNQFRRQAVAK